MTGAATFSPTQPWAIEQARWQDYYQQQIADRLSWAVEYVRRSPPSALRPHLDSLLTLLRRARPYPALWPQMVALIAVLHPWPLRWLRWDAWEREIRFAVRVYADLNHPHRQAEFLSYLARILFDTGRLDQALAVGKDALALARAHGAVIPLTIAGCTVVQTLLRYGRPSDAQRMLKQLREEVTKSNIVQEEAKPSPTSPVDRRRSPDRGEGFGQRPRPKKGARPRPKKGARPRLTKGARPRLTKGARPRLTKGARPHLTEEMGPHTTRIIAMARLGLQQLTFLRCDDHGEITSRMDEAIRQASQIIAQLETMSSPDENLIAQAYCERSTMAWVAGRYAEAVRDIKQAIQMFSQQGDEFAETGARGNLGLIYCTMIELDRAEEEIQRLIVTAERLNARWHLTYAVDYLGLIALLRGELNRATQHFDCAVDLAQRLGDVKAIHRIRSNRAVAWLYDGKPQAALSDLEADLKFSTAQSMVEAILVDCICLSLCYLDLGQRERALRLAERAMAIAQREQKVSLRIMALRCMAEHCTARRAYLLQQALGLAQRSRRLLDEAGCLLAMAGLAQDVDERLRLWTQGTRILEEIGATAWLRGASPQTPPRIIILM